MSGCTNCCKCFEQADGTIIKRSERNGAFIYTLPDLSITDTMPGTFITTTEVDCAKFDLASQPPKTIDVLEEVDTTGSQTGVLVQVVENADGTIDYFNLSTGAAYTLPAGFELHTSEDTDYNEHTYFMCDAGIDVKTTVIYKDGDITDVVSSTTTKLDGSAHTLSGNEVAGSCSGLISTDKERACFLEIGNANAVTTRGYIRYTTNNAVTPAVTTTEWFDNADTLLSKTAYTEVECC